MTLTPAEAGHLRWLLEKLLPAPEAAVVYHRHAQTPAPTWREVGRRLDIPSLKAHWLYRKALKRLRLSGRLLSALLLEMPAQDR